MVSRKKATQLKWAIRKGAVKHRIRKLHRFPLLPQEIRQLVFELCLPHRVVASSWLNSSTMRRLNRRLSVISQVCTEARDIALLNQRVFRSHCAPDGSGVWRSRGGHTSRIRHTLQNGHTNCFGMSQVFFNPKTDTLWLIDLEKLVTAGNSQDIRDYCHSINEGPFDMLSRGRTTAIEADDILQICLYASEQKEIFFREFVLPSKHCAFIMHMTTVSIAPQTLHRQSRRMNRFGLFGEDHWVLVDIFDRGQHRRYCRRIPKASRSRESTYNTAVRNFPFGICRYCAHSVAKKRDPSKTARQDSARLLHAFQQMWLELNDCFLPERRPVSWFESAEEGPNVKLWDEGIPIVQKCLA